MTSKHTPGPWAVQKAEDCTGRQLDDLVKWVVTGDEGDLWISTGPTWDPEHAEESEANARLIATAPELLEALTWVEGSPDDSAYWIKKVRAAIAKATGAV